MAKIRRLLQASPLWLLLLPAAAAGQAQPAWGAAPIDVVDFALSLPRPFDERINVQGYVWCFAGTCEFKLPSSAGMQLSLAVSEIQISDRKRLLLNCSYQPCLIEATAFVTGLSQLDAESVRWPDESGGVPSTPSRLP
jgi:hypothetical protein